MIFASVTAENFFSIGTKTTWKLKDQGLVLIVGENHDSSSADSNGSGKSTMFEALVWALWGKTVRGQDGDAVINRKVGKNCRVTVWLEHEGQTYEVERCRKFGKDKNALTFQVFKDQEGGGIELVDLTQGTPTLTQKKIDAFLGIDYKTFIRGPMLPQGSFKRFSELTDSEQKDILERAVQIGVLKKAQEVVKEKLAGVHQKAAVNKATLGACHRSRDEAIDEREKYIDCQEMYDRDKRISITLEMKKLVNLLFEREDIRDREPVLVTEEQIRITRTNLEKEEQSKEKLKKDWDRKKKSLEQQSIEVRATHRSDSSRLLEVKAARRKYESTKEEDHCPTCGQEINEEVVDKLIEELSEQEVKLHNQITMHASSIHEMEEELEAQEAIHNQQLNSIDQDLQKAYQDLAQMEQVQALHESWQRELDWSLEQEKNLRKEIRKHQQAESPFVQLIADCETKINDKAKEITKAEASLRGLELELEILQFWQEGFSNRGLKSQILESVTPFMNDRAAHYIQTLSAGELTIKFSTHTKLKSGDIKEQFNVTVTNRNGADTYAGNSGGEKGRADLAINFTLSDLVSSRAHKAYPQRFFDEPFEGLDESGVEAVMDLLAGMEKEAGSIFVITHQDGMKGRFNKTIKVVKRDGFSQMVA